jgi:hypothetical protein
MGKLSGGLEVAGEPYAYGDMLRAAPCFGRAKICRGTSVCRAAPTCTGTAPQCVALAIEVKLG